MYKAIHWETNAEIVILEPTWAEQINSLRDWGDKNVLVCQGCQQPVRVRAGQFRAWHFAHKHRQTCPIDHESQQLLQARALLYRWLVGKFGAKRVTVEKQIEGTDLPRPVDCWVTGQSSFAYWIFEVGLTPQRRNALHTALTRPDIIVHWIFLTEMLHQAEGDVIHLTTTERDFVGSSNYDLPMTGRRTLHYLDHEMGQVTTYRGLSLKHSPQVYQGKPLSHPIDQMLVAPRTGEFVHPGEYERLKTYQDEQQRWERDFGKFTSPTMPGRPIAISSSPMATSPSFVSLNYPLHQPTAPIDNPMGICEICGEETQDWYYYNGKTGMCRCRTCERKGRMK